RDLPVCLPFHALCPFFFNDTPPTAIYTLSLHDALPILAMWQEEARSLAERMKARAREREAEEERERAIQLSGEGGIKQWFVLARSEEHTSELQSLTNLVCRLLLEKKKTQKKKIMSPLTT